MTGPLPVEWSCLSNLVQLRLDENSLTGLLPAEWSHLSKLKLLELEGNNLTGPLPAEWGRLSLLRHLRLTSNSLSGPLPPAWGRLSKLEVLHLSGNRLSGPLPTEWSRLSKLEGLWLTGNSLTGPLPQSLTDLTALEWFHFDDTELCAPPDHALQAWLHGIEYVRGADCVPVAMEQHDRAALIALYEATGGPNWKNSENWLSDAPLSDWHGVTTDRNGRVMELKLWGNNLRGPFPVELGPPEQPQVRVPRR